jgi:TPR repeat protein
MVFARQKPADFADLRAVSGDELQALVDKSPQIGVRLVEAAAKSGLFAAQLAWARMLLDGRGVPVDKEAACHWFTIAAESGDPEAIALVGHCYELGLGVPVNRMRAAVYYRQAARKNHALAQHNLGQLLLAGDAKSPQRREGIGWHLVAAKSGYAASMNVVGRFCEEGWDMPKSVDNALGWYRKAAEAGDNWGRFNLGRLLADDGDLEEAVLWLRRAVETGSDDFVAEIVPALTRHADPDIRALGETAVSRRAAKSAEAMEDNSGPRRPTRPRFGIGWLLGNVPGAPAR